MKIDIFKRIVLLLGGMFLLCGCEKEELIRFDNTNTSVSFRTKETIYSFMTKPDAEKDTVKVVVNVMGMPVAYDRSFAVEVLPEKTTADSKNYKILKAEVKAMELEGVLWVEIHNQESLRETVDSLHLRIVDSKDFQVGDINASTNLITWTAKIVPPITWRVMAFWFCTIYSEEVYQRIIEFTGLVEINATYSYLNTSLDQKLYPKM